MKKSFTLIELIVVIAIIAILAAIIAPNAFKAIEKAKISKAITDVKTYKTATYAVYADTGHWPGDGPPDPAPYQNKRVVYLDSGSADFSWAEATMYPSNLMIDDDGWSGWDGPYLEKLSAKTPWGGTYFFYRWDGFTNPIWRDYIFIIVHDVCYPPDERRYECELPGNSAQRIDDMIDDGNTTWESGLFSFYEPAADPEEDAYIWGLADVE